MQQMISTFNKPEDLTNRIHPFQDGQEGVQTSPGETHHCNRLFANSSTPQEGRQEEEIPEVEDHQEEEAEGHKEEIRDQEGTSMISCQISSLAILRSYSMVTEKGQSSSSRNGNSTMASITATTSWAMRIVAPCSFSPISKDLT